MAKYATREEAREALATMLTDYESTLPPSFNTNPLRDAINSSPDLRRRMVDAVQEGYLEKFENVLPPQGAGGGYSAEDKSIVLHHSKLGLKNDVIFMLGHETQHALSLQGVRTYHNDLVNDVDQVSRTAGLPHDYTPAVSRYVEAVRTEEAQAHIGGFNALHSALAQKKQPVTLEAMYDAEPFRMRDFITQTGSWPFQQYALRPNLTPEQNGTLAPNPGNLDAMKTYYADKMPGTFGSNGLLNYRHEAILEGWNQAHSAEVQSVSRDSQSDPRNEPKALVPERSQTGQPYLYHGHDRDYALDFDQLGVNRALIRAPQNNLVHAMDLNAQKFRMEEDHHNNHLPPPTRGEILNTVAATLPKTSGVVDHQTALQTLGLHVPQPQASSSLWGSFTSIFKIEEHPGRHGPERGASDPPLLAQATSALEKLGSDSGIKDPESLRNAAVSLALKAQSDGLTSIDQVVKNSDGDRLIAIQGQDPAAPESRHSAVEIAKATLQPAEEGLKQLQNTQASTPGIEQQPQAKGMTI